MMSLFVAFVVLQLADYGTTAYILQSGIGYEGAPIAHAIVASVGVGGVLVLKLVGAVFVYLAIIRGWITAPGLGLLVLAFTAVVAWNTRIILGAL